MGYSALPVPIDDQIVISRRKLGTTKGSEPLPQPKVSTKDWLDSAHGDKRTIDSVIRGVYAGNLNIANQYLCWRVRCLRRWFSDEQTP